MFFPKDPNPLIPWVAYTVALSEMTMAANEIILRRAQRMASGEMTPAEAIGMVMEKGAAFATAAERAAVAAANGGHPARVLTAALAPYGAKTRANVRQLRK